jgi:hypothetical protein
MAKIKKILMTNAFVKSLGNLSKPKKKTTEEIAYENAIKAVEKSASIFGWNMDRAFADLMAPVLDSYMKESKEIIDWSWKLMTHRERNYCQKCDEQKIKTPRYKRIKEKRLKEFKDKILGVRKALYDMQIEGEPDWEKAWGMKEPLPMEYEHIPIEGKKGLIEMKIKPEFAENQKANRKIYKYNDKRTLRCYKWRNKQLTWFVCNLKELWY